MDDSGRPAEQAKVSAPAQQIMAAMEIDHDEPSFWMRSWTTWRTMTTTLRMSR